jgi:hypothetical protein
MLGHAERVKMKLLKIIIDIIALMTAGLLLQFHAHVLIACPGVYCYTPLAVFASAHGFN